MSDFSVKFTVHSFSKRHELIANRKKTASISTSLFDSCGPCYWLSLSPNGLQTVSERFNGSLQITTRCAFCTFDKTLRQHLTCNQNSSSYTLTTFSSVRVVVEPPTRCYSPMSYRSCFPFYTIQEHEFWTLFRRCKPYQEFP